jgi:hypothetical protein
MNEFNLPRLLTFNCHEAWLHQLEYIGYPIDIIDGLSGRYCNRWDLNVRPCPRGSNLVHFDQIMEDRAPYGYIKSAA